MSMIINGITYPDLPADVLATYPNAVIFYGGVINALIVSSQPFLYVPRAIAASLGGDYNAIVTLTTESATYAVSGDEWGKLSDASSYPIIKSDDVSLVFTNHDIYEVTAFDANYTPTLGDIYYQTSVVTTYAESYDVPKEFIINVANQIRRLARTEGVKSYSAEAIFSYLESVPRDTIWIEDSTYDYPSKTFTSEATYIYAPPAFTLVNSGVESVVLPNATEIGTKNMYSGSSLNNGWNYRSPFTNCDSITTINAPVLIEIGNQAFEGTGITSIHLPLLKEIGVCAFQNCNNLTKADFSSLQRINAYAFYYCSNLTALILRRQDGIAIVNDGAIFTSDVPIINGTGYIYVPKASVDDYKTDEFWSTYAAQIRAIEDYPDICGAT